MNRFRSLLTKKHQLSSESVVPGRLIVTKDTKQVFMDTDNGRIGLSQSRSYSINLYATDWVQVSGGFVQTPSYSTEIFGGVLYDDNVNVLVAMDPAFSKDYSVIARENSNKSAIEFYSDKSPTVDITMNLVVLP